MKQLWLSPNGFIGLNALILQRDEGPQLQFCALAYRPQDCGIVMPGSAQVVLVVLKDDKGNLRFLVDPGMAAIVREEDASYLDSLFQDFLQRAKLHPEELFKQLSSLNVGLLVTQEVGSNTSDSQALADFRLRFVEL